MNEREDLPEFPDDKCVAVLRSTVKTLLGKDFSPQQLCDSIVAHLHLIERAGNAGDWVEVASNAGSIASEGLVLMLHAMARKAPRAKA